MNALRTIDEDGRRPIVHLAAKHPVALCPSCSRPSRTSNGSRWRDVSICVCRFVCKLEV
jgi:transposase